jgi:hypothetical protein
MSTGQDTGKDSRRLVASLMTHVSHRWEELFFLFLLALLSLQVFDFVADAKSFSPSSGGAISVFVSFESFVVDHLSYAVVPLIALPLVYLAFCRSRPRWLRRFLDVVGLYVAARMLIQLIGLNLLVFDSVNPRFTLITQLFLFLPYLLLVWGWIYWRLDSFAATMNRRFFQLDCERSAPRPVDYLVASFSTVFSASISAIKGRTARAKALIIVHGFFVYDVMGLIFSRAVALVQAR